MLYFDTLFMNLREAIAMIGVAVICGGALRGLYQLLMLVIQEKYDPNFIRLQFGKAVILGLEFMVGADIIGSLVSPNYYNLGMLAIIVAIRTVLSFFLSRELETLSPQERKAMK